MLTEDAVKRRVLAYLEAERPIPGATEEEKLKFEYLDAGFVDSIKIVEMVTRLEDDFGVRFEPEHMQSEEFRTVSGVIRIIQRLAAR